MDKNTEGGGTTAVPSPSVGLALHSSFHPMLSSHAFIPCALRLVVQDCFSALLPVRYLLCLPAPSGPSTHPGWGAVQHLPRFFLPRGGAVLGVVALPCFSLPRSCCLFSVSAFG